MQHITSISSWYVMCITLRGEESKIWMHNLSFDSLSEIDVCYYRYTR